MQYFTPRFSCHILGRKEFRTEKRLFLVFLYGICKLGPQKYNLEVQSFCAVTFLSVYQFFLLILFYHFPRLFQICFGSRLLLLLFLLSVLFCTQQPFGGGKYVDCFVVFFNRLLSAKGNQRELTAVELFGTSQ